MREEVTLHGIVLSSSLQSEYDRRMVVLTKERGRITVFASGVRRGTNPLQSKTQMFVMGSFTLIPGRDSYRLVNIDVDEYFHQLTMDIDAYCYASYFCEVMGFMTHEGDRAADYLNLLYVSLKALEKGQMPAKLIRCVYEIKLCSDREYRASTVRYVARLRCQMYSMQHRVDCSAMDAKAGQNIRFIYRMTQYTRYNT